MIIHPVNEQTCKPHFGRPVCVVLKNGTRYVGIISRLQNRKLILNEQADDKAAPAPPTKKKPDAQAGKQALTSTAIPRSKFAGAGLDFGRKRVLKLSSVAFIYLVYL